MRRIDELHLEFPFAGSRLLRDLLAAEGSKIGRRHATTLMKRMGIEAIRICCAVQRSRDRTRFGRWTLASTPWNRFNAGRTPRTTRSFDPSAIKS
jgi:hypothetical protein